MKSKANFERCQKSIEERLDSLWQPERAEPSQEEPGALGGFAGSNPEPFGHAVDSGYGETVVV